MPEPPAPPPLPVSPDATPIPILRATSDTAPSPIPPLGEGAMVGGGSKDTAIGIDGVDGEDREDRAGIGADGGNPAAASLARAATAMSEHLDYAGMEAACAVHGHSGQ